MCMTCNINNFSFLDIILNKKKHSNLTDSQNLFHFLKILDERNDNAMSLTFLIIHISICVKCVEMACKKIEGEECHVTWEHEMII